MMPPNAPTGPRVPISLCLIAKNERRNLDEFMQAVRPILGHPGDEIILVDTGSKDNTETRAEELGMRVFRHPELCTRDLSELGKKWMPQHWEEFSKHPHFQEGMLRSFAEARQLSFKYARNEHCMWLDLDDSLVNAQMLRPVIDQVFGGGRRGALFLRYDYSFDKKSGACTTQLWRERVVTKSDFEWKGLCHETLIPVGEGIVMARDKNLPLAVVHRAPKQHKFSDLRNYIVLRNDLEVNGNHDPRTLFYLGNSCRGLDEYDEALKFYHDFVHQSGSRDDIMAARLGAAGCYGHKKMLWASIQEAMQAVLVNPRDPRPYYFIANAFAQLENWKEVIKFVELGDTCDMQDTLHASDPLNTRFQPAAMLAAAYRELKVPDAAVEAARRALEANPTEEIHGFYEDMVKWARAEKMSDHTLKALSMARDQKAAWKALTFSPHLLERGIGSPEIDIPGDHSKPNVTFWCGTSGEPWGPLSDVTGIGASEKMVVDLAKKLAKKGFNVAVYCSLNCNEGEYDGVNWKFTGHFNPELPRDNVIIWRVPAIVGEVPFNTKRLFVWMHDVGTDKAWTPKNLPLIDKVFFLSEFQRSLHPSVPDDQVYLTRNGIDLDRHLYDGREKKKKIAFISSPDRGMLRAIKSFEDSGLVDKGYELHIFYGFGKTWRKLAASAGYGHIVELNKDMRFYEYEDLCLRKAESTPGVVYRGRCGWDVVAGELMESEIWLYPTNFDEISCVAGMEAMAAGCKLVATDHAALKETLTGYPGLFLVEADKGFPASKMLNIAVNTELDPEEVCKFALKFDINKLAAQWAEEVFCEPESESE